MESEVPRYFRKSDEQLEAEQDTRAQEIEETPWKSLPHLLDRHSGWEMEVTKYSAGSGLGKNLLELKEGAQRHTNGGPKYSEA